MLGMQELADRYGRVARDLRVSLTDRCNLRCTYCMPAEGLPWLPTEETLTDAEVVRLLRIAVEHLGVHTLRFTGGEPLLRKGLEGIIAAASRLRTADGAAPDLALTTNGLGLDKRLPGLIEAGLKRVNVSVDSLDPTTYARIARRDRLPEVLRSIQAVDDAGLRPLKINAVVMRGENEDDVLGLAGYALEHGYQLRFIEQMPLGPRHTWDRSRMVSAHEILDRLGARYTLTPAVQPRGAAPAALWNVAPDATQPGGAIGIIASVTAPFCADCDRTRITSDGQVRSCLFSQRETDLRALLRGGGSDEEIAEAWMGEHLIKPRGHGIDNDDFVQPERTMSAIGG
ncbi:cyclic pyranopterin monophosphate synthase subunit MoaA [Ruaniaceae bacterium KH17]|nr:cyclic pyranopterin monophosphate synthase subunit MoaA [Ruaniaceae bacterium KH17]